MKYIFTSRQIPTYQKRKKRPTFTPLWTPFMFWKLHVEGLPYQKGSAMLHCEKCHQISGLHVFFATLGGFPLRTLYQHQTYICTILWICQVMINQDEWGVESTSFWVSKRPLRRDKPLGSHNCVVSKVIILSSEIDRKRTSVFFF